MATHEQRGLSPDIDIAQAEANAALKEAQLHGIHARNRAIELATEVAKLKVQLDRSQAQGAVIGSLVKTVEALKTRIAAFEVVCQSHGIPLPPPYEEA